MMGHVVQLLTAGNSCKVSENVLCPALIMSIGVSSISCMRTVLTQHLVLDGKTSIFASLTAILTHHVKSDLNNATDFVLGIISKPTL